jgi:hypothetical protein
MTPATMTARFPGRCACGGRFPVGTSISYDRGARKVVGCPACNGKSADGAPSIPSTDLGQPETPRADRAALGAGTGAARDGSKIHAAVKPASEGSTVNRDRYAHIGEGVAGDHKVDRDLIRDASPSAARMELAITEPAITTECPALTPLPVEPALTPPPVEPAPRVAPAGLSPGAARFGEARWQAALACAEAATAAEPRSDDGSRYVEVHRQGFEDLLGPLGFDLDAAKGQVIYRATDMLRHGRVALTVWTTIPPGGSMARAVGDDSIKVSIVYADGRDGRDRPLLRKQPYAARTRGWRLAVLDRIEKALGVVGPNLCQKCSAPTVERKTKDGTKFHGCSRYPDCKGD